MLREAIGSGLRVACLLWVWVWAQAAPASAQDDVRDVRNTSGLAVAGGLGGVGVLSGELDYYVEWGHPRLRLGGLLGLGWLPIVVDHPIENLGVALGAFGSYGRRTHRLYFDLRAKTGRVRVGWGAFERTYWSIVGCAGYEVVTRLGFLMRLAAGVGPAFLRGSLFDPINRLALDARISLGWKLW